MKKNRLPVILIVVVAIASNVKADCHKEWLECRSDGRTEYEDCKARCESDDDDCSTSCRNSKASAFAECNQSANLCESDEDVGVGRSGSVQNGYPNSSPQPPNPYTFPIPGSNV